MTRHLLRRFACATALVAAGLTPGLSGIAEAAHVACGDILTNNATTTLHDDLGPCVGQTHGLTVDGAVAGGGATVVDLGGKSIIGDFNNAHTDCGIEVFNSTGVTVKNGSIRGFNTGVCIRDGSNNTIGGASTANRVTVEDNSGLINGYNEGIQLRDSSSNTIKNNLARNNAGAGGIVLVGNSDSNTIDSNLVERHTVPHSGMWVGLSPTGIRLAPHGLEGDPDNNTISNNQVLNNALDGIAIFTQIGDAGHDGATGNIIEDNLVEGNGRHGIALMADPTYSPDRPANANIIRDNTVCGNGGNGVSVRSFSNTITANQAGDLATKVLAGGLPGPCLPNGVGSGLIWSAGSVPAPQGWDLYDETASCGRLLLPAPQHNSWTSNSFTSRNRTPAATGYADCIA